ncbi:MAG: 50S ribosomal protein L24 [Elusimicrobia bacterium]|nr:50S ribosomal protein L24 [Elusimicrobiota bacterium]
MKLKKKDKVIVLSGREKGKRGEILQIFSEDEGRVLIAKINMVTKHKKPQQNEPGGIQKKEAPMAACKVMLVCPKCDKPTRVKLDKLATGERVRVCRGCSEVIL